MPAAAVIPAPVAYIKVVAVKKLVVDYKTMLIRFAFCLLNQLVFICWTHLECTLLGALGDQRVYFEKIRVLKAGFSLNSVAWNNEIGLRYYFVGFLYRSND